MKTKSLITFTLVFLSPSLLAQPTDYDIIQDQHIEAVQNAAQIANDRASVLEGRVDTVESNLGNIQQSAQTANERIDVINTVIETQQQQLDYITSLEQRANDKRANAGIAGVAAMANVPQVTENARFSLGIGLGSRGGEQAIAVGFSSYISNSVISKVSLANDTQSQWTVGVGIAVQW